MIGMSLKWDEWRKNNVDYCQMIWMSLEWDGWLLNDVNDRNESKMRQMS